MIPFFGRSSSLTVLNANVAVGTELPGRHKPCKARGTVHREQGGVPVPLVTSGVSQVPVSPAGRRRAQGEAGEVKPGGPGKRQGPVESPLRRQLPRPQRRHLAEVGISEVTQRRGAEEKDAQPRSR